MPLSAAEREHMSLLRRHAAAAANLAQATADAASPLAMSRWLQVRGVAPATQPGGRIFLPSEGCTPPCRPWT